MKRVSVSFSLVLASPYSCILHLVFIPRATIDYSSVQVACSTLPARRATMASFNNSRGSYTQFKRCTPGLLGSTGSILVSVLLLSERSCNTCAFGTPNLLVHMESPMRGLAFVTCLILLLSAAGCQTAEDRDSASSWRQATGGAYDGTGD